MPFVETTTIVKADREKAYRLASDMESYPMFMKDVQSIRVLERGDGWTITEWKTSLQGRPISWKEKDTFDDRNYVIEYRQIEGDLKKFEGRWEFTEVPEGTLIRLTVDFEIGIPMFSGLLDPVAKVVVKRNCESMLAGMKAKLEED